MMKLQDATPEQRLAIQARMREAFLLASEEVPGENSSPIAQRLSRAIDALPTLGDDCLKVSPVFRHVAEAMLDDILQIKPDAPNPTTGSSRRSDQ